MSQTQPQNPEVKTVKLTGTEIAVPFSESHPCCWVINLGDSDLYASARPNIVPDADGVYLIPAGGRERITPESGNTIYVYGTGKAMIRGENDLDCPSFRRAAKGGENCNALTGYVYAFAPWREVICGEKFEQEETT